MPRSSLPIEGTDTGHRAGHAEENILQAGTLREGIQGSSFPEKKKQNGENCIAATPPTTTWIKNNNTITTITDGNSVRYGNGALPQDPKGKEGKNMEEQKGMERGK